jgi:chloramphenicol-sensitive protein RarD
VQLAVVGGTAGLAFGTAGAFPTLMLASAGIGPAVPRLLFATAPRRLPLTVVGFLQYLAPVLQFLIGVVVLHEAMPAGRWLGFGIVWVALVLLVTESAVVVQRAPRPAPLATARVTDG